MSGTPQARTPAKNPAGHHPARRRLSAHVGAKSNKNDNTNGSSPPARQRANPTTPPSSAKKKKKPNTTPTATSTPAMKQQQQQEQQSKHDASDATARAVAKQERPFSSSSSGAASPGSGRRQTGAEGVLTFLNEEADIAVTAEATPPRPSQQPAEAPSRKLAALHVTELCLLGSPPPPTIVTAAVEDAPARSRLHSPCATSPEAAGDVSPAAGHDSEAENDSVVRGEDKDDAASTTDEGGACRVAKPGSTPAPLPVTPERPVQTRYFRCAKPLLQVEKTSEGGAAVEEEVEQDSTEETTDDEALEKATTRFVGGDVQQSSNSDAADARPTQRDTVSEKKAEEEQEDEEEGMAELAPRVLDMNTTLLGEDEDNDEDSDDGDAKSDRGSNCVGWCVSPSATAIYEPAQEDHQARETTTALHGFEAEQPPLPKTVAVCPTEEKAVAEASAFPLPDSDAELDADTCSDTTTSTSLSANSSFSDSRTCSSSSSNTNATLHRVSTAAPTSMRSPSSSTKQNSRGDSHAMPSAPASANTSTVERQEREVEPAVSLSPAHTEAGDEETADAAAKRTSLSINRGHSSSYGCTEGINSPASHGTRRSTPRIEEAEVKDDEDVHSATDNRRSTSPVVVSPSAEFTIAQPSDVHLEASPAEAAKVMVVRLEDVHVRLRKSVIVHEEMEAWMERQSCVAVCGGELQSMQDEDRSRMWSSALASLETLVTEYEANLLRCVMKAFSEAWLPTTPLTGLCHVNSAALLKPPYARIVKRKGAKALAPSRSAASRRLPPPAPPFSEFAHDGLQETAVDGHLVQESEMSFLFRLYVVAPSQAARERLCQVYFSRQLQRYHNWVHHLEFEFLYMRMVAIRAIFMLEMHERRLTCMRRDLGIRDCIELFVLLAPRPRAPTVSASRTVFSAFRMAFHAIGGDHQHRSDTKHTATTRPPSSPPQRQKPAPKTRAATATSSRRSLLQAPTEAPLLFTSERCGSGKYAVPVVCELAERPAEPRAAHPCNGSRGTVGRTEQTERKEQNGAGAPSELREITREADPPRESAERHCGTPRPLNKTYSNYYKMVAEKKSHAPPLALLADVHLPQLLRTTSRAASSSRRASTSKSDEEEKETGDARRDEKVRKTGRFFSQKPKQSPRRHKDQVLKDGRLRAKEKVASTKRTRTPPRPPTEADFVNLCDDGALRKLLT